MSIDGQRQILILAAPWAAGTGASGTGDLAGTGGKTWHVCPKKLAERHLEIHVYTEDVYGFTSAAHTVAKVL